MNWNKITQSEDIEEAKKASFERPVILFKHSTSCSISSTALNRFERKWNDEEAKNILPFYLDLLNFRPLSRQIAEEFGVEHQSPQLILLKDGKSVYDESHFGISFDELIEKI